MAKASANKERDEVDEVAEEDGELGSVVEFSEDISEAEAPDPLPIADNYPMSVQSVNVGYSKSSGRKQADVTFVVSPEDYPADYDTTNNPDGVFLHKYLSMEDQPKARYQVRQFEEALGLTPSGKSVDTGRWIGCQTTGAVSHEPWEGSMRERLGKIKAAA